MEPYIPTQGAALALVARIRLQAASSLYNGGDAARRFFWRFYSLYGWSILHLSNV